MNRFESENEARLLADKFEKCAIDVWVETARKGRLRILLAGWVLLAAWMAFVCGDRVLARFLYLCVRIAREER